jgi:hypothetical protein
MSKLTLDPQLRAKLNGLSEHLVLCDDAGKTVGHFLPDHLYQRLVYDSVNARVTDEELRQAAEEPGGRSLAEIWASLEQK